jgi:hypothetical protein
MANQGSRFEVWQTKDFRWGHKILYYHDQPICPAKHSQENPRVPATVFVRRKTDDVLGRCEECYNAYRRIYEIDGYQIMTYDEFIALEVMES